ncbi:galanin receptor 2b-like [Lineus longissimus]|uniref:galanin receptor 2b-like n=1 Tax=Lineus longissimus TaxID=88925 RepID=UPI002B4F5BC7
MNPTFYELGITPLPTSATPTSYPALEIVYTILTKWAPYPIFTIGFFGNTLSLLITTKQENRHITTCVYMTALAVIDNMFLALWILSSSLTYHGLGDSIQDRHTFHRTLWYLFYTTVQVSRLILAAMTVDRAYAVMFPLAARSICTVSKTIKVILFMTLIPTLVNISMFFTFDVLFIGTPDETGLLHFPQMPWVEVFFGTWTLLIAVVIPFIIILISNIIIIYGVRRAATNRSKMADGTGNNAKENHLTKMLILISVAYVILCLPYGISEVVLKRPEVAATYDLSSTYWRLRLLVVTFALSQISALNHVVNFYLYILGGGKHYRDDVKQVFKSCCGTKA